MSQGRLPEYAAAHLRIKRAKGPAKNYECLHCHRAALDWAYDGSDPNELVSTDPRRFGMRYSLDIDRYLPLCRGCHNRLDGKDAKHLRDRR